MALGRGYALPFIAGKQGGGGAGGAYGLLWQQAINANVPPLTAEDFNSGQGSCLFTRGKSLYDAVETKPSLLIVPQIRGAGKLAVDIPSPVFFDVTRATTATRVNSSGLIESVASGVPRLDWYATPAAQDAAATGCPALLVEASGTNLALQSAGFQVSGNWTPTNTSVSTGTTAAFTAPDGTTDADLLTSTSASSCNIAQDMTIASGTYTISVFGKAGTSHILSLGNIARGARGAWFNLNAGVVTGTVNGGSASMQNYGNGWYRCIYTSSGIVSGSNTFIVSLSDAANGTTATSGTNLYVWGAQLETGSIATTYIPTTAAAVSRAADVISASGALVSGLIGQTEGTIYAEVDVKALQGSVAKTFIDIGATNNRIFIGFTSLASNTIRLQIDTSANPVRVDIRSAVSSAGIIKVAAAYQSGNCVLYVNGVAGTVSANDSFSFSTLSNVFIGQTIAGTAFLNDRIRAAALYTTRLSNDQLAELTT